MKHTILITAHPDESAASEQALLCCQSIVSSGNQVSQVFFMHDANYVAVHSSAQQWSAFAAGNQVALQTCVSTAEQKAIQSRYYAAGFLQGGLSALADSILSSNVVLQFNHDVESMQLGALEVSDDDEKIINFVFENPPLEGALVAEGIDLLLVLCAFEANLNVIFKGEGIKNIIQSKFESPRYVKRFKALYDFGIETVFVLKEADEDISELVVNFDNISLGDYQSLLNSGHTLRF